MSLYLLPIQYFWFRLREAYQYWFDPPARPLYFCSSCRKPWKYLDEGRTPDQMCGCRSDGLPPFFILLESRPGLFICPYCDMNGHVPIPGPRTLDPEIEAAHLELHRQRRDEMREQEAKAEDTSLAGPPGLGHRTCRKCRQTVYVGSQLVDDRYRVVEGHYEHLDCDKANKQ